MNGLIAQLGTSGRSSTTTDMGGWWSNLMAGGLKEAGLVIGILLVIAVILFVGAKILHGSKSGHKKRATYPKYQPGEEGHMDRLDEETGTKTETSHRRRRHRHRSRKSDHVERTRNPTLADTGGLPPLRDPGQHPEV